MTANMYLGGDPTKVDASGYVFGDILAADATGTLEPVTVGVDGFVLTADSVAPEGVDWQAGGGGGGGTPSNTVVTETSFGQASTAGAAVTFSRGDHTHGTPASPSVPSAGGTVVTETSFGQASTAGVGAAFSRSDHTHGTPAAPSVPAAASTVVTEQAFGQSAAVGVDAIYARQDHTHGTPAAPTVPSSSGTVAAETTYGISSAAGVAATFSRGDHTHGSPSLGTSSTTAAAGDDSRITGAQQRSTLTTKGDLYVATASATVTRQGVGADGFVLTANSALANGIEWAAGGGGGSTLVVRRARVTSGDVPLNLGSGAWNLISGFSLSLPAAIGDYVELGVAFMTASGNAFLDLAVVVSAAAVRYNSTDTNTPAVEGAPWLYKDANTYRTVMMPWGFEVVSGDLDSGNVVFGVAMKGTTGTLFSSTAYPFFWIAKNYGAANVA